MALCAGNDTFQENSRIYEHKSFTAVMNSLCAQIRQKNMHPKNNIRSVVSKATFSNEELNFVWRK